MIGEETRLALAVVGAGVGGGAGAGRQRRDRAPRGRVGLRVGGVVGGHFVMGVRSTWETSPPIGPLQDCPGGGSGGRGV